MPVDYTTKDYDFYGDEGADFTDHLQEQFQLQEDNVLAVDADVAAGNALLHGLGAVGSATLLTVGTGLSCRLNNCDYLLDGRLYAIAEVIGYKVVSLPLNATRYLYVDATGDVTLYETLQATNPTGTWYAGSATTDATSCTAVDDSAADRVASPVALQADVEALQAAVGDPYTNPASLDTRLQAVEGAGGGGGGLTSWGTAPKAPGDPTTPGQEMDAKDAAAVAAHVAALHDSETATSTVAAPWDVDANNQALALMQEISDDNPTAAESQRDSIVIVPGKWGDSTDGSPDFVNRTASTWTTGLSVPA